MDYVGRLSNLLSSVSKVYNELNPATLSGAIDIVVVEQPNGDLACSPFHVRFGKLSLLMPQEKKVSYSSPLFGILIKLVCHGLLVLCFGISDNYDTAVFCGQNCTTLQQ
jgi:phosphatidate phosphatase PAH1